MIIFKQTFKKLFFSTATVVVGIISLFMSYSFLSGTSYTDSNFTYAIIQETIFSIFFNYNTLFIWFFFPVYISINSVKFISDEIQDGTFLLTLSNPISRGRILIEKFAALQIVNMMFGFSVLSWIWYITLTKFPVVELWDVMVQTLPTTIYVTFLVQLFITILLVILSLKFNPAVMMGIGISISLFAQLAPQLVPNLIQKNREVQNPGIKLELSDYEETDKGQKFYKKYLRPFMYVDHLQQIYWESISDKYAKYGMKEQALSRTPLYNQEALFKKIQIDVKDKLGKTVKEDRYLVIKTKPWVDNAKIKIYYFAGSILLILFGFIYFKRKDIL